MQKHPNRLRERVERGIYRRRTKAGRTRYEYVVTDPVTGGNEWRTTDTLEAARAERGALKAKAHGGQSVARPARVRFADYAETWLADTEPRKRASTAIRDRSDVERHLIPRLGRLYLTDLDTDRVAKLAADLSREGKTIRKGGKVVGRTGLSAHSVNGALGVLSRIMNRAVRAKLIPANPVALLTAEERPASDQRPFPVLEAADLAAFMRAVQHDDGRRDPRFIARDTALVWLALTTGLRMSEALGLRWRDVDMDAGELHVRQAHGRHGDTGLKSRAARRTLVIEPGALRMLAALSLDATHDSPDDTVFCTADGKPLGHRNVLRIVERARAESGLDAKCDEQGAKRLTFHGLRHAYVSLRIAEGHALADVSRAAGHSDMTTTARIYAHAIREADRRQRDRENVAAAFDGVLASD
jgi:integrase